MAPQQPFRGYSNRYEVYDTECQACAILAAQSAGHHYYGYYSGYGGYPQGHNIPNHIEDELYDDCEDLEEQYVDEDEDCDDGDCEYCKQYYRQQMLSSAESEYHHNDNLVNNGGEGLSEYYPGLPSSTPAA